MDCGAQRKDQGQCHSPGPIDTAMIDSVPQEMKDGLVSIIPMGRIGKPREIATAMLLLASDNSHFVTGIELLVDGGYSADLIESTSNTQSLPIRDLVF